MTQSYSFCPKCSGALEERYIARDEHNRLVCSSCGFIFYQNSKPCASALVEKDGKVLLARRAVEPFKGYWDIPGGFLENGEHPEDGVVRELLEETGLSVRPEKLLGIFMDTYGEGGEHTLNLFYQATVIHGDPEPASDVEALEWFGRDELPERIAFNCCRQALMAWRARQSDA